MILAAATGPMTGMMTLTNFPSEPQLKAFRVDLRCSGKSMKSQLCSAEREHWLKPITVQRAVRVRRQRHACNHRKVAPEIRVDVLNVQGMSWTKRSYRSMLWHIVMKMREQNADVMFLSDLSDERRKQSGDVGTRGVHAVCEWYGRYCVVSLFCVTRTAGNKRWIGLTVRIGVFRYHLLPHYMPTQSGGSAHGPRHEHLEHGTELLSKLKRSGDHVILGGDANSHLGPDERLNGFVGTFTTQTSSSRLSWQFVEWCVQEGLLHVKSHLSCKRRGTWYHNYVGKWYEQDVIGGDCARTRLLELTTEGNGFPLCLWAEKHLKCSRGVNEEPPHPLRWDLTRGREDEAQRLVHSWHDSLVNQMETGKLTREVTWEKISEVMRGVAEKVLG